MCHVRILSEGKQLDSQVRRLSHEQGTQSYRQRAGNRRQHE
jgi:hypothetical protein